MREERSATMAMPAIRPATWNDRAEILALITTMGGHESVGAGTDPMRELGSLLRNSNARALVATIDGRVVGVAIVQACSSLTIDERVARLSGVAVQESLRGSGIGAALMLAVDDAARSLGCTHVVLQSSARRTRAHEFYRKNGYDEQSPAARFARRVDVPPPEASLERRFLAFAARAASAVDAAIVDLGDAISVGMGADGAATEAADRAAETAAVAVLRELALPIVSEEAGVIGDAPQASDTWISLDPLDGSRNFRAGYPPYAIAIGLVRAGVALAGFVCDLSSGRRWWAGDDGHAYADGIRVHARRGELIGFASPTRGRGIERPNILHRVRISGCCAIDLCRVADGSLSAFHGLGRAVVHVHDLAGASAILRAAGATVCDERGAVPQLVPEATRTFTLVAAADPELAHALLRDAFGEIRPLSK